MMSKQVKYHDLRLDTAYLQIEQQRKQISALKKLTATGLDASSIRIAAVEEVKETHRVSMNLMQRRIMDLEGRINQLNSAYKANLSEHLN